jgi:hypothetical protein
LSSRREVLCLAGYALVVGAVLLLDPPALLAGIIGAPLVLLAPGLALVMALDIDGQAELPMRRLIVSIALSLAVAALGGIVINTFAPLDRTSWTIWFLAFTCACCAVAAWRAEEPGASLFASAAEWLPERARREDRHLLVGAAIAVVLILAGAAVLTSVTSRNAYDTPMIELSAHAAEGSSGGMEIEVTNRGDHPEKLRLTYREGTSPNPYEDFEVPASKTFSTYLSIGDAGVDAVLTKPGQSEPLGELILAQPGG